MDDIGIQSVDTAVVETLDTEKAVSVESPVLNSDGTFYAANAFNPIFDFSLKGRGDIPSAFVVGSDGGGLAIDGIVGGKTILTDVEEGDKNDGQNSWGMSGKNFPGA